MSVAALENHWSRLSACAPKTPPFLPQKKSLASQLLCRSQYFPVDDSGVSGEQANSNSQAIASFSKDPVQHDLYVMNVTLR
jgi:hypothetical protein